MNLLLLAPMGIVLALKDSINVTREEEEGNSASGKKRNVAYNLTIETFLFFNPPFFSRGYYHRSILFTCQMANHTQR